MTYALTATQYVEINGVPLSTTAWATTDIADLLSGPGVRGADVLVPFRPGQSAVRRTLDAREVSIPMTVFGTHAPDGTAYTDPQRGLIQNLDLLKALVARPVANTASGTVVLKVYTANTLSGTGETRRADVHVSPNIQVARVGTAAAEVVLTVTIPGGVLKSDAVTTLSALSFTTAASLNATNPGSSEVIDATVTVTSAATTTSLRLANTTWDPTGGTYIEYNQSWSGTLTFNCGLFTATVGTTRVDGNVVAAGSALWLPLLPGANTIAITRAGSGNADATLTFRGAWA